MKKNLLNLTFLLSILNISLFADITYSERKVSCVVSENENKIICDYKFERNNYNKEVSFLWYRPDEMISRDKTFFVKNDNSSIYDYRFIKERMKGLWNVKVIDGEEILETSFELK